MDYKDYYAVLGVAPDASDQAIKDAYRKLARQSHPDINPGDKQAEERFKGINEAYQALSDPERRRRYNEVREQYQNWQQRGGGGDFNWERRQAAPAGAAGAQSYTSNLSPEDLEDLFGDATPFSDLFSSLYGQGQAGSTGAAGTRTREVRARRGRDLEVPVEITLEEAFHGTTRTIQVGDRRIDGRIPPGVRTGSRVRLAGQGAPGMGGGPAGDLYLVVEVAPDPRFEREGDDLKADVRVDFYTAALGGEIRVATIDGAVTLKIPPRTQADRTFRLRGKGMPRLARPVDRGDLLARVKLVLPEELSDDELKGLRELAQTRRRTREATS